VQHRASASIPLHAKRYEAAHNLAFPQLQPRSQNDSWRFLTIPCVGGADNNHSRNETPVELAAITAAIKDIAAPVRAIVIDTLRKATPGKSENDSKDMSVLLSNCDFLANTFNCHVNAVHHSPRSDDTRGSGTNAIEGSCDVILPVTRCDKADGTPRATVTVGRMKDGPEGDTWSFELRPMEIGVDRNGCAISAAYVVLTDFPARREPPGPRPASAAKRPSPQGAKFLKALQEVLAGPDSVTRDGRRCATMENWKAKCVSRGLLDCAKSNSSPLGSPSIARSSRPL
jgi:hypothetical protein